MNRLKIIYLFSVKCFVSFATCRTASVYIFVFYVVSTEPTINICWRDFEKNRNTPYILKQQN